MNRLQTGETDEGAPGKCWGFIMQTHLKKKNGKHRAEFLLQ